MVDWAGGAGFDVRPGESARVMATILFTDMVGSTEQARKAGDAAWKRTVAMHDDVVRTVLVRFGGREVETAGDSFLIVFDGAERAIRCGLALVEALAAIRVLVRVGIHSGEVGLTARVGHHPRPCRGRCRTGVRAAGTAPPQGPGARTRPVLRGIGHRLGATAGTVQTGFGVVAYARRASPGHVSGQR
jgi:hypothetical protein